MKSKRINRFIGSTSFSEMYHDLLGNLEIGGEIIQTSCELIAYALCLTMSYTISFYNNSVQKEIDRWPTSIYAKFLRIAEQIEQSGPNLGLPYTRALGDGLFEIRAKGHEGIGRAFFCCIIDREVIILHGFIKKTKKTPVKEIQLARKRLKEVKK